MKISLYACLYMNIICWRFHIKTLFALFTDRLSDRPTEWSTDESTEQSTNQPTDQPTNRYRPTYQLTETDQQTTDQLTDLPTDWLIDWLTYLLQKKRKIYLLLGKSLKKSYSNLFLHPNTCFLSQPRKSINPNFRQYQSDKNSRKFTCCLENQSTMAAEIFTA